MRARATTLALFALVLFAAPACLPVGEPPVGRQILAVQGDALRGILPARSPDDGVTRVLASRQRLGEFDYEYDLSVLSVPATGAVTEELLVGRFGGCTGPTTCVEVDHRGRLLTYSHDKAVDPSTNLSLARTLTRIDLETHERSDLGGVIQMWLSPSRRRVALWLAHEMTIDGMKVIEADDTTIALPSASGGLFLDEDFYYVDNDTQALVRLRAGGAPEPIAAGVLSISEVPTTEGARLLLRKATGDPLLTVASISLLNPVTGDERLLPFDDQRLFSFSSDGHWALAYERFGVANQKFTLVEMATGTEESFTLPVEVQGAEWRPGHAEVWCRGQSWPDPPTFMKRPGQPLVEIASAGTPFAGAGILFTMDGSHVFSSSVAETGRNFRVFVGDADHPEGPRFPLFPEGARYYRHRELPDGRLVVEAPFHSADRSNIYIVDPNDGATRLLGKDGSVLVIGPQRVLATTHRVDTTGDLAVLDVDGGPSTTLAIEFARYAYVQPRLDDPDPVRPGAPIAFQFQARFASPHNGIWLATVP